MGTKSITIQVPEDMCIDHEKSTFEKIVFKKKTLTYEDVVNLLFKNGCFFTGSYGQITLISKSISRNQNPNNAVSEEQLKCILAKNKLANVARYLNSDWKPDFKVKSQGICFILTINSLNSVIINSCSNYYASTVGFVVFKTRELAKQAIEILGEEEVKLALKPLY